MLDLFYAEFVSQQMQRASQEDKDSTIKNVYIRCHAKTKDMAHLCEIGSGYITGWLGPDCHTQQWVGTGQDTQGIR